MPKVTQAQHQEFAALMLRFTDEAKRHAIRAVYVTRLTRLLKLRAQHGVELNDSGVRLLSRCLAETYCMCRDLGDGVLASELLRKGRLL